ncbi:MAG TPA: DUF938 domain-containing protein [Gammaproteobacteria bacterium]|nr:DUF938 domain-containing protein [Gammaproteobacteria bacterium]
MTKYPPKPFSEACERNKAPILELLRELFADRRAVLEIGSGTGQHAVHFAAALPHLTWHAADLPPHHEGIRAWLEEAGLPNTRGPWPLDLRGSWPEVEADAVFSANVLHIVSWALVENFFAGVGARLDRDGLLAVYGPFNYDGRFTSDSNARFEQWLKARDPLSGIRDFEAVNTLAAKAGLVLDRDVAMPANNRLLLWRKLPATAGRT